MTANPDCVACAAFIHGSVVPLNPALLECVHPAPQKPHPLNTWMRLEGHVERSCGDPRCNDPKHLHIKYSVGVK